MDELFKLLEEIFDLQMQWNEMLGRQRILWMSRSGSLSRGRYDEINQEFLKVCNECTRIGALLGKKQEELKEFQP